MKTADDKEQAVASFVTITPKEESNYDRMIRERQEALLNGCCEGYSPYDLYGYKPRPRNPESVPEPQDTPETEKKTSKR